MKFLGVLLLLTALLVAGTMDCEEAQSQEDFYCEMVLDGAWPDYKNLDCEEDNGY